jgi:hypothetical protein
MIAGTYTPFTMRLPFGRPGRRDHGRHLERGTCRRPDNAMLSAPFRAPVHRHLSRARLAGAIPRAFAVCLVAAAGRSPDRDRGRAVFVRRGFPPMEGAAVPKRDLARICRARGDLSLRRDMASRRVDADHAIIEPRPIPAPIHITKRPFACDNTSRRPDRRCERPGNVP